MGTKAKKKKASQKPKPAKQKTASQKKQARKAESKAPRRPGRPTEYTPKVIAAIIGQLERYIIKTKIPSKAEFAYLSNIPRQALYEHPEFSDMLKTLEDKREAGLEKLLFSGRPHVATGAIFGLKQMGWKDRHEFSGDPFNPLALAPLRIIVEYVKPEVGE